MTNGIITIALGDKALDENRKLLKTIKKFLPDVETHTITLENAIQMDTLPLSDKSNYGVWARAIKCNLDQYIPSHWDNALYVDVDTRVRSSDLGVIFDILNDGFDFVISPSTMQDFWHIDEKERNESFEELGYHPVQLQGGMFGFKNNEHIIPVFKSWFNEYSRYADKDQLALVRVFHDVLMPSPKLYLMGYPFNSSNGSVLNHLFGNMR